MDKSLEELSGDEILHLWRKSGIVRFSDWLDKMEKKENEESNTDNNDSE